MSSKLGVSNPVSAGQVIGSFNASSVSDTDWHTLTSNDFYDATSGTQFTDGLQFAFVALVSSSTSTLSYLKLRAAAGAGDGKTNTDGVIPVFGRIEVDVQALQAGTSVTSIAYAKGAAGDSVVIIAGFNK
jgi:hypothetical protein